jgi:hypothetical protein
MPAATSTTHMNTNIASLRMLAIQLFFLVFTLENDT